MSDQHNELHDRDPLLEDGIEQQVAMVQAALAKLEEDPAEAARINALVDEIDALDPVSEAEPKTQLLGAHSPVKLIFNGSGARPKIIVALKEDGQPFVDVTVEFNGADAQPEIVVRSDQSLQEAAASHEAQRNEGREIHSGPSLAKPQLTRTKPRLPLPSAAPLGLVAVIFAAISVIIVFMAPNLGSVQAIGTAAVFGAASVFYLVVNTMMLHSSHRHAIRQGESGLRLLGLLLNRQQLGKGGRVGYGKIEKGGFGGRGRLSLTRKS
ncbi:hypothetical protein ACIBQ1_14185 [Nonomuraea sp. NPDC050153]|uniref:hypothetical protein n=1 Tax=Nonomuraea sp. NPDC050153 TaxID=3364359 RepID=UPI00379DB1EB